MKASEFVERIRLQDFIYKDKRNCIDHIFTGREDKEVSRAATCMVITPDVLRAAAAWGADIIVTHEPTFHNDNEDIGNFAPYAFKRELLGSGRRAHGVGEEKRHKRKDRGPRPER